MGIQTRGSNSGDAALQPRNVLRDASFYGAICVVRWPQRCTALRICGEGSELQRQNNNRQSELLAVMNLAP